MRLMYTLRTGWGNENLSIKRSIFGRESPSKRKRCNNIPYESRSRLQSDTIQLVLEDMQYRTTMRAVLTYPQTFEREFLDRIRRSCPRTHRVDVAGK